MLFNLFEILSDWLTRQGLYSYFMVIDQLAFRAFAAGLLAFLFVLLAGKPVIAWLRSQKIGDTAQFDVEALNEALAAKANTPTMGGILIAAGIAGATLLFADLTNFYVKMAIVVLVCFAILGGADDWLKLTASSRPQASRQGLFAWEKLVFQLGFAALIGYFAYNAGYSDSEQSLAHVVNLPFQKTYENPQAPPAESLIYLPKWLYIVVCMLIIPGMSNAVNITDGLDGLASGITICVAIGLMIFAFVAGSDTTAHEMLVPYVATSGELAIVAAGIAGACLGFLWFNASPASVFMGDTGSLCLGALLAYIAVVVRQEVAMFIMSGVFLLEIASVVLQVGYFKATGGKRIFRCAPYHWHLHMGGWQETKIVARLWIATLLLVASAIALMKLR